MATLMGRIETPVAVVGRGGTLTARLLRRLLPHPVVELTPCQAALYEGRCRAVVVENFDQPAQGTLSGCAAARWALSQRADVTIVGLDDPEGRRLARAMPGTVYAYSDGRPQADLTAKNVRLRGERLEFEVLTARGELTRVRVSAGQEPRLYDHLAALAGALALGVPLSEAAARLNS
ncbi:MAG: hypothetical protein HDT35_01550 [Clostridiales bacterium]|nr:hypothetical protein [Clostridiales bacterium]